MAIYLSPSTSQFFDNPHLFGCMLNIVRPIGRQEEALKAGCYWILDNGQYKDKWTWALWWYWLNRLLPYRDTCLGVCIPDKLKDWILTLHLFGVYYAVPKEMGYPVALVTQDGAVPNDIPWSLVDCLFIGGSHYHKRGREAERLGLEAKQLGKKVHIGRVQAGSRMTTYWPWADSYDGTTLAKHPHQQEKSITSGLLTINNGNVPYNLKLEGI